MAQEKQPHPIGIGRPAYGPAQAGEQGLPRPAGKRRTVRENPRERERERDVDHDIMCTAGWWPPGQANAQRGCLRCVRSRVAVSSFVADVRTTRAQRSHQHGFRGHGDCRQFSHRGHRRWLLTCWPGGQAGLLSWHHLGAMSAAQVCYSRILGNPKNWEGGRSKIHIRRKTGGHARHSGGRRRKRARWREGQRAERAT